jgi:hypothetical protein
MGEMDQVRADFQTPLPEQVLGKRSVQNNKASAWQTLDAS